MSPSHIKDQQTETCVKCPCPRWSFWKRGWPNKETKSLKSPFRWTKQHNMLSLWNKFCSIIWFHLRDLRRCLVNMCTNRESNRSVNIFSSVCIYVFHLWLCAYSISSMVYYPSAGLYDTNWPDHSYRPHILNPNPQSPPPTAGVPAPPVGAVNDWYCDYSRDHWVSLWAQLIDVLICTLIDLSIPWFQQ